MTSSERALPRIPGTVRALGACVQRLAEIQAGRGCDLRLGPPATALGRELARKVRALEGAVRARSKPGLDRSVAALMGLGPGLTPSGDDYLRGFLAAARCRGEGGLAEALGSAMEASLDRTGEVSAGFIRSALSGRWPEVLVDLAEALAEDREGEARGSLERLCAVGHSSGADHAAGFLRGLLLISDADPG